MIRGEDVHSDHYLMRTRISLKLAVMHGKEKAKIKFDVCKLRSEEIRRRYYIKVKNGFEAPGDSRSRRRARQDLGYVQRCRRESYWNFKKAQQAMDRRQNVEKIQERKEVKLKIEGA